MKKYSSNKYPPTFIIDLVRHFVFIVSKILWRIEYHNRENIPQNLKSGLLIVANHQSYFDPFWICAPIKRKFRFMAWDRAFDWFFVGWLIRYLGAFPVDIIHGASRNVLYESLKALNDGATLVIFPEGTRGSPDGKMMKFKTGAIRIAMEANVPILPVTVSGANRVWSQTMKYPHFHRVKIFYHPLFQVTKSEKNMKLSDKLEELNSQIVQIIESNL